MATKNDIEQNPETAPAADPFDRLTEAITAGMTSAIATAAPKKISIAQLQRRSVFNPRGKRGRKLEAAVRQNGARLAIHLLSDEEITLLNQLVPALKASGEVRAVEGLVTAHLTEPIVGQYVLDINYANASPDARYGLTGALARLGGFGFEAMLRDLLRVAREKA